MVLANCGTPPNMTHAAPPDYDDTVEGNITKYTCESSYEFRSGQTYVSIECLSNKEWDEFPETCVGK